MTDQPGLAIEITAHHGSLESRLALAICDADTARGEAVLAEIRAAGPDTLTAVLVLAVRDLAAMATAWQGPDGAKAMLESAILRAGAEGG